MKRFITLGLFLLSSPAFAQTIKTDVLVVGANAGGVAAAIQSARSGVKTVLVAESGTLGQDVTSSSSAFKGGIYEEFIKKVRVAKGDTSALTDPSTTAKVLKAITDTVKNLTVRYNSGWEKIEHSGKGWEVKLKGGKASVKATVVVDATLNEFLSGSAGVFSDMKTRLHKTMVPAAFITNPYSSILFRTSIAVGLDPKTGMPYCIPLGSLFASGADNFFVIGKLTAGQLSPDAMYTGQAAGASAAFFAFFDESTKTIGLNMRTRLIQAELQKYGSWLFPFTDIKKTDPDFITIEHIGLTGILKGQQQGTELLFNADSAVTADEVRAPLKEFYSRSQIWFINHPAIRQFSVDDMLSLVKYVANRGNELDKEVENGWKISFGFKRAFDPKRLLTRREFSVLAEYYLKPFDQRVNLTGNLGS